MSRKQSNSPKASCIIWVLFVFYFVGSHAEVCQKLDDCSCKKSNGKVINLREIDGGSTPAFKNIKDKGKPTYTYSWNPCTKYNDGDGCKGVLMCQQTTGSSTATYPCATAVSEFKVNSDGTTSIIYQKTTYTSYTRTFELLLRCDENKHSGEMGEVTEKTHPTPDVDSAYSATLTSKCACDDGCRSSDSGSAGTGISVGSILLIVFFVLLIVYVIGGIVINKFKLGVESMPEMCPNYTFWAGIPSLIKDGVLFTCGGIKSACSSLYRKCNKDSYAKI